MRKSSPLAAFVNNTPLVAVMIPVVMQIAVRIGLAAGISPER